MDFKWHIEKESLFFGFNGLFIYPKIFKYNGFWKTLDLIGNIKEIIEKNSMISYG